MLSANLVLTTGFVQNLENLENRLFFWITQGIPGKLREVWEKSRELRENPGKIISASCVCT